jgi:hypothetical protein
MAVQQLSGQAQRCGSVRTEDLVPSLSCNDRGPLGSPQPRDFEVKSGRPQHPSGAERARRDRPKELCRLWLEVDDLPSGGPQVVDDEALPRSLIGIGSTRVTKGEGDRLG